MTNTNKGMTIWLTGLSGAGKSTLSEAIKLALDKHYPKEHPSFIFDGDIIRKGLNKDLGFSKEDRAENIRRIAEVAKLFGLAGQISIVSFISPYSSEREFARALHREVGIPFIEVFVSTSLEVCEQRDVKGLYKKARTGEIKNFTGVSDPYESPESPEILVDTKDRSVEACVWQVFEKLLSMGLLSDARFRQEQRLTEVGLLIEEEDFNWLQCFQQGWLPDSLKAFMNEQELLECLYFRTVKGELQSVPVILPIEEVTNAALQKWLMKQEEKAASGGGKELLNLSTGEELEKKKELSTEKVPEKNSSKELISSQSPSLSFSLPNTILLPLIYNGAKVAYLETPSSFGFRQEEFVAKVFGTTSPNHPKINKYLGKSHLLTGTKLHFPDRLRFNDGLDHFRLAPQEIKQQLKEKNADCVYCFQLRNPLHNGHLMLLADTRKSLLERGYKNPVLLLHPCGGWTKDDDVPLNVRVQQHLALLENSALDPSSTLLAVWPAPMFYAGPMEVLFHFSSRVRAEVTYMIVGRDPAGVKHPEIKDKDLFEPTHGAKVLQLAAEKGLLKQTGVLPFKVAVYNKEEKSMEYFDVKNKEKYDNISGSKMRELARSGGALPEGFMHPKGWEVLVEYYKSLNN